MSSIAEWVIPKITRLWEAAGGIRRYIRDGNSGDMGVEVSQAEIRAFVCCESELAYQALKLTLSNIDCVNIVGYATDGLSGLEQILQAKPDIALVAARLSLMDGPELIQQVRRQYPETRLVVVAQAGEEQAVEAARAAGADAFCFEPAFATLELLSAIHAALAARRNQKANGSTNGTANGHR